MLALFWVGAMLSAWLGYKLQDWWVPTALTAIALAGQFVMLQTDGFGGPRIELMVFGLMDLIMFHATFGIGRSIGQRFSKRRKGAR